MVPGWEALAPLSLVFPPRVKGNLQPWPRARGQSGLYPAQVKDLRSRGPRTSDGQGHCSSG